MKTLPELKYTKNHEWARIEGNTAVCGITDFAQEQLGDIVFVELPELGSDVVKDGKLGVVESVKAASDVFAPLSGKVIERNDALESAPEPVNKDAFGEGWMAKVELSDPSETASLMDAAAYEKFAAEEHH